MTVGLAATTTANAWLDGLCRSQAYSDPASFNVKLHTGDPGSAGTSNVADETTRKAATFSAASGGSITTSADLEWTNVSDAETYSHVSFWSDISAGNFLGSGQLTTPKAVTAGDNFTIPAGSFTITLSPIAA